MFAIRLKDMKCIVNRLLVVAVAACFFGCAAKSVPNSGRKGNYNDYSEDLSEVRPAYTPAIVKTETKSTAGTPESKKIIPSMGAEAQHVNRRLDEVMDASAAKNKTIRYAAGYRIQVYTGNERQSAEAAKLLIYQNFPELNPYLSYKQPTYKLKVGDFMRKLDAERYYSQIKSLFPTAVLQPDKIDIRYSMSIN